MRRPRSLLMVLMGVVLPVAVATSMQEKGGQEEFGPVRSGRELAATVAGRA